MSVEVMDNKIVSLQFDNRNFEKNVAQSMSTLEKLQNALKLKDASKGIDDISNAAKKIDVAPVENAINKVENTFNLKTAAMFSVVSRFTNRVADKIESVFRKFTVEPVSQGWDEYGLKLQSIQTIMNSSGESLETVNGYIQELNHYADKTIYSFSDMTNNIGKFTNAGVKLNKATKAIQGVANVAASAGVGANEASRAMYNFSQALSVGSVKLLDWKSIENANMATTEFKTQLLETAAAMKVVEKTGDGLYKTAKGTEVTAATLREALSEDIITSDVLLQTLENYATDLSEMSAAEKDAWKEKLITIGYTEEQISKIEEISEKAFKSATEIKTFNQLIDTLMEAAGSGWAETWEIIFGDLEEAKKLWTGVNDVISPILDNMANFRNNLLQTWKDMGGRTQMIRAFSQAWKDLNFAIMPLRDGFRKIFPKITADNLVNFSYALHQFMIEIKPTWAAMNGLKKIVTLLSSALKGALTILGKVFGILWRGVVVIQSIANHLLEIIGRANSLGDALTKIFGSSFETVINAWNSALKTLSVVFGTVRDKISGFVERTQILQKILVAIVTPFIILKEVLMTGVVAALNLISKIDITKVIGGIASFLGRIKSVLSLIKDIVITLFKQLANLPFVKNVINFVKSGLTTISEILGFVGGKIASVIERLRNFKITDITDKLSKFLDKLKNVNLFGKKSGDPLVNFKGIPSLFSNISVSFEKLSAKLSRNPLLSFLKRIIDAIGNAVKNVKQHLATFVSALGNFVKTIDLKKVLIVAAIGAIALVIMTITKAIKVFTGTMRIVASTFSNVNALLASVKTVSFGIAPAIIAFAIAIGTLTVSLFALSKLPQEELEHSAIVLGLLSVTLAALAGGLYVLMTKLPGAQAGMIGIASMAAGILLMVVAFNSLEQVDLGDTLYRLGVLGSMAIIIGTVTGILTRLAPSMAAGAISVLAVSASLLILAKAVQNVTNMGDMDAIAKNAASMCKVLVAFSVVMWSMKGIRVGAGLGLIGMTIAINAMIKLVRDYSKSGVTINKIIEFKQFLRSFSDVFIAYFALSVFGRAGAAGIGLAATILSLGLVTRILVKSVIPSIIELAKTDPGLIDDAGVVLMAICGAMAVLSIGASIFSLAGGRGAVALGIMMLSYAGVFSIMTNTIIPALMEIANTDTAIFDKTIKVIGGLTLAFSVLMVAAGIGAKGAIGTAVVLAALAGVLYVVVDVIVPIVKAIDESTINKLIVLVGSMTVAFSAILIFAKTSLLLKSTRVGLVIVAGVLVILGGIIYAFSTMPDPKKALAGCASVAVLIGAMAALMVALKAVGALSIRTIAAMIPIALVAGALGALTVYLSSHVQDADKALLAMAGIAGIILAMSGAIAILGAIPIAAAINGALGLLAFAGILIGGILLIAGIFETLGQTVTDEDVENINKLGELLTAAGEAIGGFFGGIIGAFAEEALEGIAKGLTDFAIAANPFFIWVQKFDDTMLGHVSSFSASMILIGAAEFVAALAAIGGSQIVSVLDELKKVDFSFFGMLNNNITDETVKNTENLKSAMKNLSSAEWKSAWAELASWLGGDKDENGNKISNVEKVLTSYGNAMKSFIEVFKDLTTEDMAKANIGADMLETAAKAAENADNFSKLSKIEEDLISLGKGLFDFNTHINSLNDRTIQNTNRATYVIDALSECKPPNSGGLLGFIVGNNDLDDFGSQLSILADGITRYSIELEEMKGSSIIGNNGIVCTVIERLGTASEAIQNQGGLLGKIVGENNLDAFGSQLAVLGRGVANYSIQLSRMDYNGVKNSKDAVLILEDLAAVSNSLKRDGADFSILWGLFKFDGAEAPKLGDFMNQINPLLSGLKEFVGAFDGSQEDGINSGNLNMAVMNINKIAEMCERLADADGWKMEQFGENLWGLAQTGLSSFVNVWKDENNQTMLDAVTEFVTHLFTQIDVEVTSQESFLTEIGERIGSTIYERATDVLDTYDWKSHGVTIGMYFAQGIAQGFGDMKASLSLSAVELGDTVESGVRGRLKEHSPSKIGIDIGRWFSKSVGMGIKDKTPEAAKASENLGKLTEENLRNELQIHSESPLLNGIGEWVSKSFGNGIKKGQDFVNRIMGNLGGGAFDTLKSTVSEKIKSIEDAWNSGKSLTEIVKDALGIDDKEVEEQIASDLGAVEAAGGSAKEALKKIMTDMESAAAYKFGGDVAISYYEAFKNLGVTMEDAEHDVGLFANYLLDKSGYTLKELDKDKDEAEAMAEQTEDYLQNLQKAFNDFYKNIEDKVKGFDWFSEFDEQTMLTSDITENLQERKEAMQTWVDSLSELRSRGISEEMYQVLLDKGPDGEGFAMTMAMADATDEEFEEINSLYADILSMQSGWTNQVVDNAIALGQDITLKFAEGIDENTDPVAQSSYNVAMSALNGLKNYDGADSSTVSAQIGATLCDGLAYGMDSNAETDLISATNLSTSITDKISEYINTDKGAEIGKYLTDGLAAGILDESAVAEVITNVEYLGTLAKETLESVTQVNSPSKVFSRIGRFWTLGVADGMYSGGNDIKTASEKMAIDTTSYLQNTMTRLSDMMTGELSSPVIRPTLDLSNIQANASRINSMMPDKNYDIDVNGVNGSGRAASSYQFVQNNYSPKALSRDEIYRQTKKQFAFVKEVIAST